MRHKTLTTLTKLTKRRRQIENKEQKGSVTDVTGREMNRGQAERGMEGDELR